MVQGIETLNPTARDAAPQQQIPEEAVRQFGDALGNLSEDEIQSLRELSDDLREMSQEELTAIKQVIDFLIRRKDQYEIAVQAVIRQGLVEPGDLPPEFDPVFFDILSRMIDDVMRGEEPQQFAQGGIASLNRKAQKLAKAGRYGDTMLAHLSPKSAKTLKSMGGSGTINPKTGLREYGLFDAIGSFFKKAVGVVLPIALGMTPLGPILGGAIGSGIGAMINGASPSQALTAGLMGGVGGALYGGISGMMSGQGFMSGVTNALPTGLTSMFSSPTTGAPAITPTTGVSSVNGLRSEAAMAASPSASAAAAPGFMQKATDWMSQHPYLTAGGAGLAGLALASAMTPEEKAKKMSERNVEPVRFDPGTFSVYQAPKVNVVPTYSPAYVAQGGYIDGKNYRQDHRQGPGQEPYDKDKPSWIAGGPDQDGRNYGGRYGKDGDKDKDSDLESFPRVLGSTAYQYRTAPQAMTFVPTYSPAYAMGGELDARAGGHLRGPGTGTSDDIPARLSDGEFVMTAKAVRGAGNGSRMKGAKRMYDMMHKFEKRA